MTDTNFRKSRTAHPEGEPRTNFSPQKANLSGVEWQTWLGWKQKVEDG
jgi:hypothetical protein